MWLKLASATFTTNLGKMSVLSNSISIKYNGLNGAFAINKSSVSKDDTSAELKLTLNSGWTCTSASAEVTGATEVSDSYSNNELTINIKPYSGTTFGDSGKTEIVIAVTHDATSSGVEDDTTDPTPGETYTITYKYEDSNGNTIYTATTDDVTSGTNKTFSTSDAREITGYTCSAVNPTSATITSDTAVTYTYTLNTFSNTTDITNAFSWTEGGVITASAGTTKSSGVMSYSDYVDISDAATLLLSFMSWRSSSGGRTTFGLSFYDTDKTFIGEYEVFPHADEKYGNSSGASYTLVIDVPSEATYVRTTYAKDTATYGEFTASKVVKS